MLSRAIRTAGIILESIGGHQGAELSRSWLLNERHHGAFTGLGRAATKVNSTWRYKAPPLAPEHPLFEDIQNDLRYDELKRDNRLPSVESLADAESRFVLFWEAELVPRLKEDKRILIVAHQGLLKGAVKFFDALSEEEAAQLKIANARPFIYEFDNDLKPKNKLKYI